MYKLLLCWRYLRTRYLAMACIISVMLGVATLIVVNSVMSGFSTKLRERLHGLLSDIVVESLNYDGFGDATGVMERIRQEPALNSRIEAMTPTIEVIAMIQFRYQGSLITRPIHVIGVDPEGRAKIGGFAEFLRGPDGQPAAPTFQVDAEARKRYEAQNRYLALAAEASAPPPEPGAPPPPAPPPSEVKVPQGAVVGFGIASFRVKDPSGPNGVKDIYTLEPGDNIIITTVSGQKLSPVFDRFVVCSYFKSEMSEYDSNYVFVPLDHLQHLRTMDNRVTGIQIKLKDYADAPAVKEALQNLLPESMFHVATWEDKQGPLLAAIAVEKGILNVLLFLIIAVAGFGILAIFAMIVVEKTRDIGILKALGASNAGVMNIFLGYGLLLGIVGAGLGTALGLSITLNINDIEKLLGRLTGQELFPRDIYYFDKIPTNIQGLSLLLVNVGALGIAVLFSVLPALRAALLHPVRALRYE